MGMAIEAFITAEHCTNLVRGVWVMLTTFSVMVGGAARPARFEITTSTGYRAVLPACGRDECGTPCTRKRGSNGRHSGMSVDKWLEHCRTNCHANHLAQAESFRDAVEATYRPVRLKLIAY